jgi:alpha-glucosidase
MWLDLGPQVLAHRARRRHVLVNFGPEPVVLPSHSQVLLASGPISDSLPADTAVWLR